MVSLSYFGFFLYLISILGYFVIVEIELVVIEHGGESKTIDDKEVSNNDYQSDEYQQDDDELSTETTTDTDNQVIASSMENQNEISFIEDDSPLVEDIILQSKDPKKGFLALKTDFDLKKM